MIPKKNPELEVGRNSSLYFAIGLNVMLFFSWQAIEYKTYEKDDIKLDVVMMDSELDEEIPLVTMNTPPPPPPPPVVMQESVQIIEDTEDVEETVFESTEASQDDLIAEVISVEDVDVGEIEEDVEVPFAVIEDVPLFPGCENVKNLKDVIVFSKK